MGRIAIFIDEKCEDSKRIMSALNQRSIPFEVINVSKHPERRGDMISLTNQNSTPQIFFNETHFRGGADELFQVLRAWEVGSKWGGYETPLERYEMEIAEQDDPTDPRLQLVQNDGSASTTAFLNLIFLPNGTMVPKGYLSRELLTCMPRDKHKEYINCFRGSQGVAQLMTFYKIADQESAIIFFRRLEEHNMILRVEDGNENRFDRDALYRLHPLHHKDILNNTFVWDNNNAETEQVDPMNIILKLSDMMDDIMAMSGLVWTSYEYTQFEEAVCKLQMISLDQILDDNTRVAFSLNLFNLMTRHFLFERNRRDHFAFWPSKGSEVPKLLSKIKYNVGGTVLSAYQVQHLLARGGMGGVKEPSMWTKLCNANLNREPIAIDHRIYFALSLGTHGSPIIRTYRPNTLEEDLHKAAQSYCQEEIKFDKSNGIVVFPKLFKWHRAEFGWSTNNIISKILRYLSSDQIISLKDATNYGGKNRVSKVYQNHAWEPILTIPSPNQQQSQKSSANMTNTDKMSGQLSTPQKHQPQRYANGDSPTAVLTPSDQSSFHVGDDDDSTYVPYSIGEMTKLFSSGSVSDGPDFDDVLAKGTRNMLEDRDDTSTMYDIYDLASVSSRMRAHRV